jgi:hypothetical protein
VELPPIPTLRTTSEIDQPSIAGKVPLLITDADSSQFSAIADVMDGKHLAIKGPPGTEKSQTITNAGGERLSAYVGWYHPPSVRPRGHWRLALSVFCPETVMRIKI